MSTIKQPDFRLSCGIAMCTCNGAVYLIEQLESLLAQTHLPDQIAIFDDVSDDGTWQLLQDWASQQSIPVKLHQNASRLGIVKNFEAAVQTLDTDLIFLCDQDDVWLPQKLQLLHDQFVANPAVILIPTDARLVDAHGVDMGASLFESLRLSVDERLSIAEGNALSVLCRRNIVTGATAAFRRELLQSAVPFALSWLHDEWLAILAGLTDGGVMLQDMATIQYRQHGRNAIGMSAPSLAGLVDRCKKVWSLHRGKYQLLRRQRLDELHVRVGQRLKPSPRYVALLEDWRQFAVLGATLPKNPIVRCLVVSTRFLFSAQYQRFGRGGLSALRDIFNR